MLAEACTILGMTGIGEATGFVPAGISSINIVKEQSVLNLPAGL